jgi:formamidopyrimidine-DNA glycosylase
MTGSLRHAVKGTLPEDPYRRAVVTLDDESDVAYRDVRRFGTWLLLEPSDVDGYLEARVGPEPLAPGYRSRHLAIRLAGRRIAIKAALLDQRTVAGVGNIYADEALWRARLHPLTPAAELTAEDVKAVHRAVRTVLQAGIRRQGSTLRDYRLPDGTPGTAQERFEVYGRAGEPCRRCGTAIDKIRVAGRGTWYCPGCQVYAAQAAASRSSSRPSRSRRQSSV